MIVSCLIRREEVYQDYRLHIDFNIDFEQFSAGLDISSNRRIKKARFKGEADINKNLLFFKEAFIKNTQRTRLVEIRDRTADLLTLPVKRSPS